MADLGFWAIATDDPGHLALVEADGRETSAGDLLAGGNQVARGLQALGLQKGDVVAVLLPNRREMVELALGATQIGLYLTPINYHLTGPEVAYIVDNSEAKIFVADERYGDIARKALEEVNLDEKSLFSVGTIDGFRSFDELKDPSTALPEETRKKCDVSAWTNVIHAAAPCPVEIKKRMLGWWGPTIYEYYAATEGGGTLVTPEEWVKKPGTVGKPWPISEVKILDDEGNDLPANEVGTVWMSMGADRSFEYYKDKEKTDQTFRENFFTVGDAGYIDEDGFLFLVDRKSDMIISGGVNIYPAEIESVLLTHPKVVDAAGSGIAHADGGAEVQAGVEPAEGVAPGPELADELMGFASERLAKYKLPRTIDFVPELPRDPNGKLYKRKLRDPYWEGREKAI